MSRRRQTGALSSIQLVLIMAAFIFILTSCIVFPIRDAHLFEPVEAEPAELDHNQTERCSLRIWLHHSCGFVSTQSETYGTCSGRAVVAPLRCSTTSTLPSAACTGDDSLCIECDFNFHIECALCSVYAYSSYFLEISFLNFLDFSVPVGWHVKNPSLCGIGESLKNHPNECVSWWYLCVNFDDKSFWICLVFYLYLLLVATFQDTPAVHSAWRLSVWWLVPSIECGQLHGGEGAMDAEGGVKATTLWRSKTAKAQTGGERPPEGKLNSPVLRPQELRAAAQREGRRELGPQAVYGKPWTALDRTDRGRR